ncbi:MAG: SdpI family protein [Clostridia bacterium]|nr:SdpI family protein [Clostridia bacterium]
MYFIKNNLKKLIISSMIILCPIIVGLILWNKIPDAVPIHWNFEGEVDNYANKAFAVFGLPAFLLFVHWLCAFFTCFDKKNKTQHPKAINLVFWICPVISLFVAAIEYLFIFGFNISVPSLSFSLLGITFIVIGNLLPKIKPNKTLGIKLPWTVKNEENWFATHRFGGKIWVIGGFLFLIMIFVPSQIAIWLMLAITAAMVLIPTVYSYIYYKNQIKNGSLDQKDDIENRN